MASFNIELSSKPIKGKKRAFINAKDYRRTKTLTSCIII